MTEISFKDTDSAQESCSTDFKINIDQIIATDPCEPHHRQIHLHQIPVTTIIHFHPCEPQQCHTTPYSCQPQCYLCDIDMNHVRQSV